MNWFQQILGWLFGVEDATSVERVEWAFANHWVSDGSGGFWLSFGVLAVFSLSIAYYVWFQRQGSLASRLALAASRGLLLALLLVTLAEPTMLLQTINRQPPLVYFLFDGTESMAIRDSWTSEQRSELAASLEQTAKSTASDASRQELVQTLLRQEADQNVLTRLREERGYVVEPFLFDGLSTSQLRKLSAPEPDDELAAPDVAEQLSTSGQVTALGNVLADIGRQTGGRRLAAAVMVSDFSHNSGPSPLGRSVQGGLAERVGVPLFTVGVGALEVIDLAVDLQTDVKIRKGEETVLRIRLRQTGLTGRDAVLRVTARPEAAGGDLDELGSATRLVGEKTVRLTGASQQVEMPFTPTESGRFRFQVEAEPLQGEIVEGNNVAWREANVIDDYVRLMYVAFEPSWEWRFVKEVFHRDKTVGIQGFRTYLASSDPRVRESNTLFLPTLTPQRSEFFTNDVIFLDDMPRAALTPRFCEMVREFVGQLGGGLVVIAGPRFGPAELVGTDLAEMLPVRLDPELALRDDREFFLKRTPQSEAYPFMRLGKSDAENDEAWRNLGKLPWYQPVAQVHERAEVLAEHPTDTCRDGRTPQPLIAVRRFGEGEVVYLAFNEFWRLRRRYGERYYRDFWSPLIDRLGLSHDLGRRKRFVPRLDRDQYRVEDTMTLTVQAFDNDYLPLKAGDLDSGGLEAEMLIPDGVGQEPRRRSLAIPYLRPGTFELRLPVYTPGVYRVRVKDPLTGEFSEREFEVADVSAERRSAVRDRAVQEELARLSGGRSYDLTNVHQLVDDLVLEPVEEQVTSNRPLWTTPLWFVLLATLLLGEWVARKWVRLS